VRGPWPSIDEMPQMIFKGASDCTATEVKFINQARPPRTAAATGTWVSKVLPLGATRADVRAALPAPKL
jgi:hypothetical protein